MSVDATLKMLGIVLPPYKLAACHYLESHGFRFCVDFGYENATEKARAHWTSRKKRR